MKSHREAQDWMEAATRELDHCDNLVGDEDSLNTKLALVKVSLRIHGLKFKQQSGISLNLKIAENKGVFFLSLWAVALSQWKKSRLIFCPFQRYSRFTLQPYLDLLLSFFPFKNQFICYLWSNLKRAFLLTLLFTEGFVNLHIRSFIFVISSIFKKFL